MHVSFLLAGKCSEHDGKRLILKAYIRLNRDLKKKKKKRNYTPLIIFKGALNIISISVKTKLLIFKTNNK